MKHTGILFLVGILMMSLAVTACGPSEEERQAAEQARLDSLRQVEEQRIAEMMQARQDSIARAEAELQKQEEEAKTKFAENGTFAVQVGAFRSEEKAKSYLNKWNDREYPHAYVVKQGDESTGNVWFRLRVGFFDTKEAAENLGKELAQEINTGYWVSKVDRS